MGWDQVFVLWASVLGSLLGGLGCTYAAVRLVSWKFGGWLKLSLIISATLAFTYTAAYLWLLMNQEDVVFWSRTMRPLGMVAWFLGPWTALPFALIVQVLKLNNRMNQGRDELLGDSKIPSCHLCLQNLGYCPFGVDDVKNIPVICPLKQPPDDTEAA